MPQKFLKAKQQSEAFVVMRCKLPTSAGICNDVFFLLKLKALEALLFLPKETTCFFVPSLSDL